MHTTMENNKCNNSELENFIKLQLMDKKYNLKSVLTNRCWRIDYSGNISNNRGIFATKDIEINTEILYDIPLIIGPTGNKNDLIVCVCCYEIITENDCCPQNCGLPICSVNCSISDAHKKECDLIKLWDPISNNDNKLSYPILKILTAIRGYLLSDEQKKILRLLQANRNEQLENCIIDDAIKEFRNFPKNDKELIDFLKFVVSINNTNAFQTVINTSKDEIDKNVSLKGLYPLTGLLNHQCTPNTRHSINKQFMQTLYATKRIRKGEEIFTSYSQILWNTITRYVHLTLTKQFQCVCKRCQDPTENNTFLSSLKCFNNTCTGILLSQNPLQITSAWKCNICNSENNFQKVLKMQEFISSIIKSTIRDKTVNELLEFVNNKILKIVPVNSQFMIEVKLKILWKIGNVTSDEEFTTDDYHTKIQYCKDILKILELLNAGECTMKGLLLLELFKCIQFVNGIQNDNNDSDDKQTHKLMDDENLNLLINSYEILKNNIAAPNELHVLYNKYFK